MPDLTPSPDHETSSKERYKEFQKELEQATDSEAIKTLAARVDVQLKLEDFLTKSRVAGHPKMAVWGPIFVPAIVSVIVATLALFVHKLW
jgi:hypothetical protein